MNDLPKRKGIRLKEYDYSQPGYYFVTICTNKKQMLFGEVTDGVFCPNFCGEIAMRELLAVEAHRPDVTVEKCMVMPNHIHAVFRIHEAPGRDTTCRVRREFSKPQTGSLSAIIGAYKAAVTRGIRAEPRADMTSHVPTEPSQPIWQGRYYEHILRSEREYLDTWSYIEANPLVWAVQPREEP